MKYQLYCMMLHDAVRAVVSCAAVLAAAVLLEAAGYAQVAVW